MEGEQGRASLRSRVWVAVAVLGVSLVVLAITPALVSVRTRALRTTITEVAEPTISAVSGIERSVLGELAALRGYALHGDREFLRRYTDLREEEREELARLRELAARLDPEVVRHARRLETLASEWHQAVEQTLVESGADSREAVAALDPASLRAEARSLRRSTELLERLRRNDIADVERFEVWLNRVMLLLAAFSAIALALLGRRLHALAAESQADRDRLSREVTRRARLIRGLSHDLKNPLGVADAHAEFLDMGVKGPLSEDQRESVGAIRRSVSNTVRLIDDLLHLARAERGELPVRPVPTDFAGLVAEAAADARSRADAARLELEVRVPSDPIRGITDPRRVREIVDNLVSNAIRYTPAGGAVRVGVAAGDEGEDADEAGQGGQGGDERGGSGRIRIFVSDTGPGIAPADQERIFQEFERASHSVEGSGLGLAISREMAALLGGEIQLESDVDRGATFTLILPRGGTGSSNEPAGAADVQR